MLKTLDNKILIFSDLDNTLWQSNKTNKLLDINETIKISNEENSFMDEKQVWLYNFLQKDNALFIPTTARNLEQYNRTFLKERNYPVIILNLGCTLLLNGEIDKEWNNIIENMFQKIDYTKETLKEINKKLLEKFNIELEIEKHPYAYKKINDIILFKEVEQFLIENKHNDAIEIANSRNVIFYKPIELDKSICVSYVIEKMKPKLSIGLGDSFMDKEFLKKTDFFFIPKNSELGKL